MINWFRNLFSPRIYIFKTPNWKYSSTTTINMDDLSDQDLKDIDEAFNYVEKAFGSLNKVMDRK